ncbi:3-hydroxybutyryl-CoA dehydrogenase [Prauserella marina]|uniref:3-hydroxybutyryl-CoA dehydrogenase n=2 Tax=Prauserella marina TaxID=530584 RepID=A0A222W064_9PSEU|nr:3-hydroxybutyryl-CoA dehydrogenase [Prauserella marina]PWV74738.1 3-hydroxybutyryl-CoA dehydrogenase [Prauserella marina]SDD41996.1 3-hydroxybutyryl-CoA dehydrogenase [Prauserella marina]
MGAGIAEICALAGLDVVVCVTSPASAERGRARIVRSLDHALRKGKLTEQDRDGALERLSFTADLDALADRQIVIESVLEDEAVKVQVFRALDKVVDDQRAILATNTSATPIMKLGRATERAGHVVGTHFFNPAPVLPLVEIVPSLLTEEDTVTRIASFVTEKLGKQVVRSPDRAGFMVNALLIPYLLSAIRMLESGFASAEDIDSGMRLGCAHPMGPLRLVDMIGLDVINAVAESLHAEFREPHYSPPPLLLRMVDAGLLGKKTGRGFHEYAR